MLCTAVIVQYYMAPNHTVPSADSTAAWWYGYHGHNMALYNRWCTAWCTALLTIDVIQGQPRHLQLEAFSSVRFLQQHPLYSSFHISPLHHMHTSWYCDWFWGNSAFFGEHWLHVKVLKMEWLSRACLDSLPLKYDRDACLECLLLWAHSVLQEESTTQT
jgi:hypothetical protein